MTVKPVPPEESAHELLAIEFGGWHKGDNHKPGRGFYFMCSCGKIGLGQILPASAERQWKKHAGVRP